MTSLVDYKKARFNFEILETFEAGLELSGHEVKSLKNGQGSLDGSHVIVRGGEAYAVNVFVPPYQEKNTPKGYEPRRNRRLLLTKKEIHRLAHLEEGRGLTIVPISIYNKGPLVKVSVAVVRGKKQHDKRASTKDRETAREARRAMNDR
ncbi:MAG: SsrA-binding protein SsrA-binding protein [Candidatus Parcubacteria bacterium]|nr:SsrA-binding protein SsrA-binding protein [Candidatus Parcubacteria bacterium]